MLSIFVTDSYKSEIKRINNINVLNDYFLWNTKKPQKS